MIVSVDSLNYEEMTKVLELLWAAGVPKSQISVRDEERDYPIARDGGKSTAAATGGAGTGTRAASPVRKSTAARPASPPARHYTTGSQSHPWYR